MDDRWHPAKGGKPNRGTPRDHRLGRNPDTPAQRTQRQPGKDKVNPAGGKPSRQPRARRRKLGR
jgi:hypothetical protein